MEEPGRPRLTNGIWARALEQGDKLAIELIDEAVRALGVGVASAVNVLDIEVVVLGGGMGIRFGAPFAERLREAMRPLLFGDARPPATVSPARCDAPGSRTAGESHVTGTTLMR